MRQQMLSPSLLESLPDLSAGLDKEGARPTSGIADLQVENFVWPRVLAQLIPVYSIDLKHAENDALSAQLRVGARF